MINESAKTKEIITLIDQLIQELSKSRQVLAGVGYVTNLPKLITLKEEYTSCPNKESMEKIYHWILGGNAWPEGATWPENMFLIWNMMSKLRDLYEKTYVKIETEKGQIQILNIFINKAKINNVDLKLEWGPERFDNDTYPLAIYYKNTRKIIYFSHESIEDYVNDENVKAEIGKILDNFIETLIKDNNQ